MFDTYIIGSIISWCRVVSCFWCTPSINFRRLRSICTFFWRISRYFWLADTAHTSSHLLILGMLTNTPGRPTAAGPSWNLYWNNCCAMQWILSHNFTNTLLHQPLKTFKTTLLYNFFTWSCVLKRLPVWYSGTYPSSIGYVANWLPRRLP